MSARELAWRIASEAFGEGAARNAFAENVEGHLRLYERAAHEAGRREGIEEAVQACVDRAMDDDDGDLWTNGYNIACSDLGQVIRALLQRPGGEEK